MQKIDAGSARGDQHHAGRQRDKADVLRRLSELQGVYVPSLYEPVYGDNGALSELIPLDDAPSQVRRWVADNPQRADELRVKLRDRVKAGVLDG